MENSPVELVAHIDQLNRPYVLFDILLPNGQPVLKGKKLFKALVDSGASSSVFPKAKCFMDRQGHDFDKGEVTSFNGVNHIGNSDFSLRGCRHETYIKLKTMSKDLYFSLTPYYIDKISSVVKDAGNGYSVSKITYDKCPIFGVSDFFKLFNVTIKLQGGKIAVGLEGTKYGENKVFLTAKELIDNNCRDAERTHSKFSF